MTRVIDGDTIELADGEDVRIVGIDTPEAGDCHSETAARHMEDLVLGKEVVLVRGDEEDRDQYGRLLRYVDVDGLDAGLSQIRFGLATARYDSRDGYGFHPREPQYVADDLRTRNRTCDALPAPARLVGGSDVHYENCDAARAAGAAPVTRGEPGYGSHLDRDGDGSGCEPY